jgi:uncharacterized cofD-like protein
VGARVVGIGGGHGLAVTLRAARHYATELTAVVSVADDGGSSGRLREVTGLPAMGDIRYCLSALADPESRLGEILEHRFTGELDGHAFGNLLIAALSARMGFTPAIDELTRLVGARARLRPVTETPVVLAAATDAGLVHGQVAVQGCGTIKHVALDPADARPAPDVVDAIADADQIVLGPGSLYTSVLAALALPAIREAVAASSAQVVYVCNLRPQVPETNGYDVAGHLDALEDHGVQPDVVICQPGALAIGRVRVEVVSTGVARPHGLAHDPDLLAGALSSLLGRGGDPE